MSASNNTFSGPRYRSLFWPVILIGAGVIFLLFNTGIFGLPQLAVALRFFPLLLIAIGLDLLFGRRSASMGAIIGVVTVVIFGGVMLVGPSLGLIPDMERNQTTFSEPHEEASSYSLTLETTIDRVSIGTLQDSNDLVDAEINHYGELDINVEGERDKFITIAQQENVPGVFNMDLSFLNLQPGDETGWNLALSPDVPLALNIDGGIGQLDLDLSDLYLTDVYANMGIGASSIVLPAPEQSYTVTLNGGIGEATITLPEGAAVQVQADTGIGSINVDSDMARIAGEDEVPGMDGVWQTDGFDAADKRITIVYDGGIGELTVQMP